jgi:hypothetical protein
MMQIKKRSSKYFIRKRKKSRIIRFLRNTLIGFVVLFVLVIIAGVVYTWYMGQHPAVTEKAVPVKTTKPKTTGPAQLAPNAKEGVAIQSITSPVAPGDNASIYIHTNRDSKCTIGVEYNKIPSKDAGLTPKTADEYGLTSWSWTVESTGPVGKWPVTVTCEWNKKTAVVVGYLIVAKK